jgi:signal transduction histidine kinase
VPKTLNGDPDRLRQVLLNLVSNAVKFTKEGEIDLQIKLMTSLEDSCHIFFIVRDTGPGIPKEQQMEIFKPFFQIEKQFELNKPPSKKSAQETTGLGLWICKVLVERMGGLISLHSEPGKGCEFRFSIRFNLAKK